MDLADRVRDIVRAVLAAEDIGSSVFQMRVSETVERRFRDLAGGVDLPAMEMRSAAAIADAKAAFFLRQAQDAIGGDGVPVTLADMFIRFSNVARAIADEIRGAAGVPSVDLPPMPDEGVAVGRVFTNIRSSAAPKVGDPMRAPVFDRRSEMPIFSPWAATMSLRWRAGVLQQRWTRSRDGRIDELWCDVPTGSPNLP